MREEAQNCHLEDKDDLENVREEGSEKDRSERDERKERVLQNRVGGVGSPD